MLREFRRFDRIFAVVNDTLESMIVFTFRTTSHAGLEPLGARLCGSWRGGRSTLHARAEGGQSCRRRTDIGRRDSPMTSRPRHTLLREATAALHDRLDTAVFDAGFFATVPLYGLYLQRLHRLHRAFEAALAGEKQPLARRFELDQRSAWLVSDLDDLRLGTLPAGKVSFEPAPWTGSTSGFFGCLYVMLGASLGARYLIRQAEKLDMPAGAGLTYLTRLAQPVHWPVFLHDLEEAPAILHDDLVAGARATFQNFYDHLLEPMSP